MQKRAINSDGPLFGFLLRAFPVKTESPEMLYLIVFTQLRTQNRYVFLLELL
jgi:hypothetical protein